MQAIPIIISFLATLLVAPFWIKRARRYGFAEKDVHKKNKSVVGLGGLIIVFGFIGGILFFVASEVFYAKNSPDFGVIFAVITSILIALVIGLIDDLLGWKIGLRKYQKILLTFLMALPIMVINAGASRITLPFAGQ